MKYRLVILILLLSTQIGFTQNKELLYNFTALPQSLLLNPGADVPFKKHLGVPLLSGVYAHVGVRGFDANDIFADDGVGINNRIANKLPDLTNRDYVTLTQQLELITIGFRTKNEKYYISGGIYQELDFISYFPKDIATLAYFGNEDPVGKEFDIAGLKSSAELLYVFHLGVNKRVNDNTTIGIRGKLYSEIASYRSVNNSGVFRTEEVPNGNNFYRHTLENANLSIQTSGYQSIQNQVENEDKDVLELARKQVIRGALLSNNIGLGIDFGFTHKIEDDLTITGSISDLGFIVHNKDAATYRRRGNYVFEGFETPTKNDPIRLPDFVTDFESQVELDTISRSYTTMRSAKIYGSISKSFNRTKNNGGCDCWWDDAVDQKYQSAYGLQVFSQFRPRGPQFAGTLFLYHRFSSLLQAKATYTVDEFSYYNMGLLLSTQVYKFNFYLAANNLVDYANLAKANSASLQLGFNLIF